MRRPSTSCLVVLLAATLPAFAAEFRFARHGVLGTSFDLTVILADEASADRADRAERAALDEIDRLCAILSAYQDDSELSRLNAAAVGQPVRCSAELIEVLAAYERWTARTGGAYSARVGALTALWRSAERTGHAPADAELARLTGALACHGWRLDPAARTVARLDDLPLNIDSLGKGYILARALAAARKACPDATGLLLDLGGDLLAWGSPGSAADEPWLIAVADPRAPFDNAEPLTALRLPSGKAVATSGLYERGFSVAGQRLGHILDPRTGRPTSHVLQATVLADDNPTANALATSLCVLSPEEGLRLVERTPGAAALLILADGRQVRSGNFPAFEARPLAEKPAPPVGTWPGGSVVTMTITLPPLQGRKVRRPYVAVWIEKDGKPVRTVTVWGNERKYLRDLPAWWKFAAGDPNLVRAVTRATRAAGRYTLVWDGLDDKGNLLPAGTYTVVVEANREKGRYCKRQGTIAVGGAERATGSVPEAPEFAEVPLVYGPPAR